MPPSALSRAARVYRDVDDATRTALFQFAPPWRIPEPMGALQTFEASLGQANLFVAEHHRHHEPTQGHLFSVGLRDDRMVLGYAIVGRPVARRLDDGCTAEVLRVATLGTRNACSKLYGAIRRRLRQHNAAVRAGLESAIESRWLASRSIRRIVTYTLADVETGASLRAAGFTSDHLSPGGDWGRTARPRCTRHPTGRKLRWVATI